MTHLYIEQNTGSTEEVNSSIISKLYELAISGDLDETSDLKGRLHSVTARDTHISYLTSQFNNLYITADTTYKTFVDSNVETLLTRYMGDGYGVTLSDITSYSGLLENYTNPYTTRSGGLFESQTERDSITSFNELLYFSSMSFIGATFYNCHNLTSVALPASVKGLSLTFENCNSLTTINLQYVENLGFLTFKNSGLTGEITLNSLTDLSHRHVFAGCTHITAVNFVKPVDCHNNGSSFEGCTGLLTVTGLSGISNYGGYIFSGCTSLTSVDLNSDKLIREAMFYNCSSLTTIGTWVNNTVSVEKLSFYNCQNLEFPNELNVYFKEYSSNGLLIPDENYLTFQNCKKLKKVILQGSNIQLGLYSFAECTALTEIVNSNRIKWIGNMCFNRCPISGTLDLSGCTGASPRNTGNNRPNDQVLMISNMPNITKVVFGGWDLIITAGDWNMYDSARAFFYNCPNLTTVDMGILDINFPNWSMPSQTRSAWFSGCPNITTFIIRNTSVVQLANSGVNVDPLDIGGVNATLYVPDNIVNDYKAASGWSNIANLIKGISLLPS